MCVDIVAQCDWCLFRRHITWEHCKPFQRLIDNHIKDQDFPLPTPDNRCKNVRKGWGEHGSKKAVKIHAGACPTNDCVSELLGAIKRKEAERLAREEAERRRKAYLAWEKRNIAWGKEQKQKEILIPPTESMLTLGLIEQEDEEDDGDEWEDLGTYDNGKGDIEEQIAQKFRNQNVIDGQSCKEEKLLNKDNSIHKETSINKEKPLNEEKPLEKRKPLRIALIVKDEPCVITLPMF